LAEAGGRAAAAEAEAERLAARVREGEEREERTRQQLAGVEGQLAGARGEVAEAREGARVGASGLALLEARLHECHCQVESYKVRTPRQSDVSVYFFCLFSLSIHN
jgi:hypothetical protein